MLVAAAAIDTLVVRTVFVPAVMLCAVDWNWWPAKMPHVTIALEGSATSPSPGAYVHAQPGSPADQDRSLPLQYMRVDGAGGADDGVPSLSGSEAAK